MSATSLTRRLFLRLLGLVYLVAFASLALQIRGLVGEHGILPAERFLDWAHSIYGAGAYRLLPTLFWLDASDPALVTVALTGAGARLPPPARRQASRSSWSCSGCCTCRSSVVGQDFLSFQWDALLLESGLLAVLWAPSRRPVRRVSAAHPPGLRAARRRRLGFPAGIRRRAIPARVPPLQADVPVGRHQDPER